MPKTLIFKKMIAIKHDYLEKFPDSLKKSFGEIAKSFILIVWGQSGNGKTSFIMQLCKELIPNGDVLYISLEEGFSASIQRNVKQYFEAEEKGLSFADHQMTYDELVSKLEKKRSPKFIVIDSLQYWNISYAQYKQLKERFKNKSFLFISHAKGKMPEGRTADKVRYDACVKVHVEGYVAFVTSRFGGNKPYVIWEEGAKKYWGKKFKKISNE